MRALALTLLGLLLLVGCTDAPTSPGPSPTAVPSGSSTVTPTTAPSSPPPATSTPPSSTPAPTTSTPPPVPPPVAPPGARRPVAPLAGCTTTTSTANEASKAVVEAKPGDTICVLGKHKGLALKLSASGTSEKPIWVRGDGETTISRADITGKHVGLSGVNIRDITNAPGLWVRSTNVTVEDVVIERPRGGDGDGVRFFGSWLTFRHMTISDTDNSEGHADCFQNYSTEERAPETHDVLILRVRCANIANIGVISEGPHSSYGDGSEKGNTFNIEIRDSYFQANSAQAIWLDDVQGVLIVGNHFDGGVHHAVGATNGSTGLRVEGNRFTGIDCEVGLDKTSKVGYVGPVSRCGP